MGEAMATVTGSNAITVRPHPLGEDYGTLLESIDPWYRYFRAVAELFIAGEIDIRELQYATADPREPSCPAARDIRNKMANVWAAPNCLCDPYTRMESCNCWKLTEEYRRQWLRELIGA